MLIEKIRLNFNAAVNYKTNNYTYQNILFDNVQQLSNFILGKRKDRQLTIPSMKIRRNDPIDLQQEILTMSPAERKRLGINKSTLWYEKKPLLKERKSKFTGKSCHSLARLLS